METKKKGFPVAFWVCSCSEIFERLAYYLGRSLILIFVTASVATGGLGLSDTVACHECLGTNSVVSKGVFLKHYGEDFPYEEYKAEKNKRVFL